MILNNEAGFSRSQYQNQIYPLAIKKSIRHWRFGDISGNACISLAAISQKTGVIQLWQTFFNRLDFSRVCRGFFRLRAHGWQRSMTGAGDGARSGKSNIRQGFHESRRPPQPRPRRHGSARRQRRSPIGQWPAWPDHRGTECRQGLPDRPKRDLFRFSALMRQGPRSLCADLR